MHLYLAEKIIKERSDRGRMLHFQLLLGAISMSINNELAFQPENMQYNYSRIGVRHPYTFGKDWTQGDDNFYRENFNESALNMNVDDSGFVTIALSKTKYAEVK